MKTFVAEEKSVISWGVGHVVNGPHLVSLSAFPVRVVLKGALMREGQ